MTSRTPMGVQPRPPQRTLSSSGLTVQRPSHQRTLSAQYLPQSQSQSPVRKDSLADSPADANDAAVAQNRYGTVPRRGGSRLKLEMSNELTASQVQSLVNGSPQNLTPSRAMPKNDPSGLADASSPASSTRAPPTDADNPPMPMPKRRQRFALPAPPKDAPAPTLATKKDGRPKPYAVEVPPSAPRYALMYRAKPEMSKTGSLVVAKDPHELGHGDFFPWTGNHHEDRLSDSIIKQGFFDKAPATQTETTSAKPSLWPALKHKNGLNLLSGIFVGVMNQRKLNGQVTAPSAFKPPPRVTLTDTKREVWMRDLANPSISLRRLSRTIPHGIRGKGLLDHCLNKNVPTERAVWLVRCVGANDLRTVKRKGANGSVVMGGEAKWLRDWTVFVEQFVDSVASAFGDPEWKTKVQYAIRLATHIYAEHLVDRDHYMEWLVSGLENSSQAKLPMWILITQIYWKDLLRLRKFGRRLAGALLGHLNSIHNDPDRDILAHLSTKLTSLVLPLISSSSDNFVSPTTWFKCREALFASISLDNDAAQNAYRWLNARNERLVTSSSRSQPANRQILIKHLDTTFQSLYTNELATSCWGVSDDKSMLVRTVLDWSTSIYRPGQAKIYVAAGLLRSWAATGIDITAIILNFLDTTPPQAAMSKRLFYQLISELVRSHHFNVHGYILWLMSRGGFRDPTDTDPDAPCATRLLVDLPLHCLDCAVLDTRANLLRRAAFDVKDEIRDIETAWKLTQQAIGIPLDPQDPIAQRKPMALSKLCKAVSNSSRALQTEVGSRLVQHLGHNDFRPSVAVFNLVRALLEAAKDYAMLTEMVKFHLRFSLPEILASCTDTINVHLSVFAALGAAKDLCDALLERLKIMSDEQGVAARPLLAALGSLTPKIPGLSNTAAHLRRELQHSDRCNAIDACSPVSDNTAMRLEDAESDLQEEIEKLLSSGTSVDRPTMDRLFHTVVSRLEACWAKSDDKQRAYGPLLARLRIFDPQHFDVRMTDWVHHVSSLKTRPALAELYPFLISLGCLSFPTVLTTTSIEGVKLVGAPVASGSASTYMQEVLQLVTMPLSSKTNMSAEESYRFYIQQRLAPQQHHKEVAVMARSAMIEFTKFQQQDSPSQPPLAKPDVKDHFLDLLRLLVIHDAPGTAQILGVKMPDSPLAGLLANMTTRLLAPHKDPDYSMTFETVLEMASDLALPFCQLKLSIGLSNKASSSANGENQPPSHIDMLSKAMDQAVDTKNMTWTSILPYLSEEITEHLKRQSQTRFLSLFPCQKSSDTTEKASSDETIRLSDSLLSVVESIVRGRPALKASQLSPAMVDKMGELWEILAAGGNDKNEHRASILSHWLPALLRFITLHTAAAEMPPPPTPAAAPGNMKTPAAPNVAAASDTRARMLVVLAGILLELDSDAMGSGRWGGLEGEEAETHRRALSDLRETVFDLTLLLVDNLPEESRLQCIRVVLAGGGPSKSPITSDVRLRYLFSYAPPWREKFMLQHRPPQPQANSGGANSNSNASARLKIPISVQSSERLTPYLFRKWELLCEPSPVVGENDAALSLTLFEAFKVQ